MGECLGEKVENWGSGWNWIGRADWAVVAVAVRSYFEWDCWLAWEILYRSSHYPIHHPAPGFPVGRTMSLEFEINSLNWEIWFPNKNKTTKFYLRVLLMVVLCWLVPSPPPPLFPLILELGPPPPPPPGPPALPLLMSVALGMPKSLGNFFLTVSVISPRCGV